jgi:tetratricopeptide (TPR) repeat protein
MLLGIIAEDNGDYLAAEQQFVEALEFFRTAGDRSNIALILNHLGVVSWGLGDTQRASALYEESLALQRQLNEGWGISVSLGYLGLLAGERGDHARAAALHRESLHLRWEAGAWEDIAASFADLAALAAAVDRPEQAARFFGAAAAVREDTGRLLTPLFPERGVFERAEERARAALGPKGFAGTEAAGRELSREQAVAEAAAFADEIARQSTG